MKLFGRQDLLLIGALTTALIIIFSGSISRLLDNVREIERQSGLTLMPALVLLTGALFFHQYRRNHLQQARAEAAMLATRDAEHRAEELGRLVTFGHALGRSLDFDSIRVAVSQHLPTIAGTNNVWVLVQQGSEWLALTGDTRGAEDVLQSGDLAQQLLASGVDKPSPSVSADHAVGFPLIVGGSAMGVLGVRPPEGVLVADRRRIIEAAAALLAVSIKNAQLFKEVKENSVKDALTGCYTRGHALEVIDAELRRARRSQAPVSLIMFDLDRFKDVNDRYGHLCGDAVLSAVGKRMKDVLRGSDLKCRYGGEEFLVLLPETPLHGARRVAETLRREIADRPVPWAGEGLTVTASFGLAQTLPGEVNVEAVIGRADQALYRAKDDGRNCVRVVADGAAAIADESHRHDRVV
ncbi:MAG TPA: GGDEF domain-containing protein [Vicinamibacterales bacterium]|nr:GGDEF domain-containing protein [Vicinamibacterales bacterium]